ncbi:MAG: hypothetical protein HFG89_00370 [Dorea sp.]|jgi:uncharacterized protein with gpF-like domain|nr:hypothetical protein [Dorea sp.]
MSRLSFDELNAIDLAESLTEEYMADSDYERYFGEMDLPDEEIQKRISFAEKFEDTMLFIFALYLIMRRYGHMNEKYIISQLQEKYSEIVSEYMAVDKHMNGYIEDFSQETIDVTKRHDGEEYFTSRERAILLAENEANTSLNYGQYVDALKKGYKKKIWISERDSRVRATHREVDGVEIPIDRPFLVGDSLMKFPKDTSMGASTTEIAGCRCTVKYLK